MDQFVPLLILAVFVIAVAIGIAGLSVMIIVARSLPLFIRARTSGVDLPFLQIFAMRLRGLNPDSIIENYIQLYRAGIDLDLGSLEAHVMARGDLDAVTDALISANKAGIDIDFDRIAAIDLAGRDVSAAIRACVDPVVFVCPPDRDPPATGVAKDGIRVGARVRVTLRADFNRLVGGAGQQTIVARLGEGICAAIGRCETHKVVIQNPNLIKEYILERGLDAGTAYQIVSVDVADIDILDNIGARLAEEQAESDKQVAQARAEMRRAMAFATEHENLAKVVGHTANVVAARANIPIAMANAARAGRIWRSPHPLKAGPSKRLWDVSST